MEYETLWTFKTKNFRVAFEVAPEDDNPEGHFEFPEDVAFANKGGAAWFVAKVAVYDATGDELASDYLGACSYNSFEEFYSSHRDRDPMNRNCSIMRKARGPVSIGHYFPSMVSEAIAEARRNFAAKRAALCAVNLRAA